MYYRNVSPYFMVYDMYDGKNMLLSPNSINIKELI